jgi:hypothetical protein
VVVYASSDGDARFAAPDAAPALMLDRPTTTQEELTIWGDAVSRALTKPPSADLVDPIPLAALTSP